MNPASVHRDQGCLSKLSVARKIDAGVEHTLEYTLCGGLAVDAESPNHEASGVEVLV